MAAAARSRSRSSQIRSVVCGSGPRSLRPNAARSHRTVVVIAASWSNTPFHARESPKRPGSSTSVGESRPARSMWSRRPPMSTSVTCDESSQGWRGPALGGNAARPTDCQTHPGTMSMMRHSAAASAVPAHDHPPLPQGGSLKASFSIRSCRELVAPSSMRSGRCGPRPRPRHSSDPGSCSSVASA